MILKKETANGITANIIRAVNMQPGCVAYRINNVGVWDESKQIHRRCNTEKGLPDVIASIRGRFVAIEVKAGKDRLSEDQKRRAFEIEKAGGVYFEARSTDSFLVFLTDILKK
ncbi:MAG: VRR-NUC domain-containing protein [Candidatus Obscuribacter sp.]|nr:VRR-NUC domain-containing protein [Candidatus Obscuribacter sp.]